MLCKIWNIYKAIDLLGLTEKWGCYIIDLDDLNLASEKLFLAYIWWDIEKKSKWLLNYVIFYFKLRIKQIS